MEDLPAMQLNKGLNCTLCNQIFNLKSREPIYLMCCGDVACKLCIKNDMIKSDNKEVIKKGQFECSFCHADHCAPPKYLEDMPL